MGPISESGYQPGWHDPKAGEPFPLGATRRVKRRQSIMEASTRREILNLERRLMRQQRHRERQSSWNIDRPLPIERLIRLR